MESGKGRKGGVGWEEWRRQWEPKGRGKDEESQRLGNDAVRVRLAASNPASLNLENFRGDLNPIFSIYR